MEDKGLTKMGYDDIIRRIMEVTPDMPRGLTAQELALYLDGYTDCQDRIIEMLNELKSQYGR